MTRITITARIATERTSTGTPAHRSCSLVGASVRFADRVVLSGIDLHVGPFDRIAIVGDNGAGKSTLLGLLAGSVAPTDGERRIELPGGISVAEQHPEFATGATVEEALDERLSEIRALRNEMLEIADRIAAAGAEAGEELLDRYAAQTERFEARDGYGVEQRLASALERLGLGGVDRSRPVAELSGGQRARLVLGAALAAGAELLLLDEPTNDLDDAGLAWLDGAVAAHRGALVVVSHDRAFLDRFATAVVSVSGGGIRRTGNGYAGYLADRAAERRRLMAEHEAWAEELERQEALSEANAGRLDAIPRKMARAGFGHGNFRARSRTHGAMSRIRMAKERVARLRADPRPRPAEPLRFSPGFAAAGAASLAGAGAGDATAPDRPDPILISAAGLRVARGASQRLSLDALEVRAGQRWLVSGPNGAGKTTLLDVLAGELTPGTGTADRRPGVRIARLRQRIAEAGDGGRRTPLDAFAAATGHYREEAHAALLGLGLLGADDIVRPLGELSVGQRRRLELALAVSAPSDVLLLDEPTNHLAPELIEELEAALAEYPGAVMTVTHDRRWRERAERGGNLHRLRVDPGGHVAAV